MFLIKIIIFKCMYMLMLLVIVVATIPGGGCSICCSKAGGPCCLCLAMDILISIILNNYYNCWYMATPTLTVDHF